MTLKGGTAQACAACKFQRRKCTSECLLAPYFPADQPKIFQNVHRLFGVSNIVKLLKVVEPNQKKTAMDSVIIQANFRERYPVFGCVHEINRLQTEIAIMEEELILVYQHIELYRQQQQQQQQQQQICADDGTSQLELGMAPRTNNALPLFNHSPQLQTNYNTVAALSVSQQHSYSNSNSVDYNNSSLYLDSKDNVPDNLWLQSSYQSNNNSTSIAMQPHHLVASESLSIQQGDYEEMHPFFQTVDDRQSYIYSKETYESSSEESLKDTRTCTEHSENELKNAAASFSLKACLMSVN